MATRVWKVLGILKVLESFSESWMNPDYDGISTIIVENIYSSFKMLLIVPLIPRYLNKFIFVSPGLCMSGSRVSLMTNNHILN